MRVNCPCEITASAPCSMVSLILSCFSSLREICSDTQRSPEWSGACNRNIDAERQRVRSAGCGQTEQINCSDRQILGAQLRASESVNFEVCRRLVFIAARNIC